MLVCLDNATNIDMLIRVSTLHEHAYTLPFLPVGLKEDFWKDRDPSHSTQK